MLKAGRHDRLSRVRPWRMKSPIAPRRPRQPERGQTDRGLRADRQHGVRGAGRARRLDRLAVSAALRIRRPASPRCSARPSNGRWRIAPAGEVTAHVAPLSARYRDPRDPFETADGQRSRSPTSCRSPTTRRKSTWCGSSPASRAMSTWHGTHPALRLRPGRALGAAARLWR